MLPAGPREWGASAIGYLLVQRRWKIFSVIAFIAVVFDQLSKYWARSSLTGDGHKTVITNFFDFQLSYNTGAAFSMFDSGGMTGRVLLTIVAFLALGFIAWMVYKAENSHTQTTLALGLIAGGAIGNLIDRILHGQVTDFILWRYYEHRWPIFNIADAVLLVGVGVLLMSKETWQDDGARATSEAGKTDDGPVDSVSPAESDAGTEQVTTSNG